MTDSLPLLRGKTMPPPLPEHMVARPRITESIRRRLADLPVLIVCAAAGAGKTTAVRAALIDDPRVAWLTLDAADAAPGRLLTYLGAALAPFAPDLPELAKGAMSANAQPGEVAGLLVERLADTDGATIVLDQVDRISSEVRAMEVVEGLTRFAPDGVRVVLISRTAITLTSGAAPGSERVDYLIDRELAFTREETAVALEQVGSADTDLDHVFAATGGWVVGVLFAGTTAAPIRLSLQLEADPLHAYLWAHVLEGMDPALRDFMITTSLLVAVDAPRATALGLERAEGYLTELRAYRIPGVWEPGGKTVRYHPVLRDYLLMLLERRPRATVVDIRTRFGRLLASEGFLIEAVEEFLAVDALAEALPHAESAIVSLIDRGDYEIVDRWLDALTDQGQADVSPLTTAELMLAVAREEYWRGVRIADQLAALGQREALAEASSRAAAMMIWCYYHACRVEDMTSIFAAARPGPEVVAASALLSLIDDRGADNIPTPAFDGSSVDGLFVRMLYWRGRLAEAAAPHTTTAAEVLVPWRIAALRAVGDLDEARRLYERVDSAGLLTAGLLAVPGAELFADLGREADARACVAAGRREARRTGSLVWDFFGRLSLAKLELRLCRDAGAAREVLDDLEREPLARTYQSTAEQIDTWYGLCHLMAGEWAEARARLTRAVASMQHSGRILELPTAGVYLAEAAWQCGDEQDADSLPDTALDAALAQRTDAVLIRALREFPDVLSRKLDGLATSDTEWHRLGAHILATERRMTPSTGTALRIEEFGTPRIFAAGVEVRPRIAKCYELLAYFATAERTEVTRDELLDALFDGGDTDTARSYLRQAVHQLRSVLPEGSGPFVTKDKLTLTAEVDSAAGRFVRTARDAQTNDARRRIDEIDDALTRYDAGVYLPKARTQWVDDRRAQLAAVATDLRLEAAERLLELSSYGRADELAARVIADDPLREGAWRLRMRAASAVGSSDAVTTIFADCTAALATIDTAPSRETRSLFERLRA